MGFSRTHGRCGARRVRRNGLPPNRARCRATLPALTGVSGAVGATVTSGDEASSAAVFAVAASLPRELQRAVAQVEADAARDVRVVFDDGVVVTWGSAASAAQKVSVVTLLRERKEWGRAFTRVDVSAPDAPALAP